MKFVSFCHSVLLSWLQFGFVSIFVPLFYHNFVLFISIVLFLISEYLSDSCFFSRSYVASQEDCDDYIVDCIDQFEDYDDNCATLDESMYETIYATLFKIDPLLIEDRWSGEKNGR